MEKIAKCVKVVYKRPKVLREEFVLPILKTDGEKSSYNYVKDSIEKLLLKIDCCEQFDNYSELYHFIYILSNQNLEDFSKLFDEIITMIKKKIEDLLQKTTTVNPNHCEDSVKNFMQVYKQSESLIEKIKVLFTNNKTRFSKDKDIVFKLNYLNPRIIISEYLNTSDASIIIINSIKSYVNEKINITNIKTDNALLIQIINFLQNIGLRSLLNEIIDCKLNGLINEYKILSEKEFENINELNLPNYLLNYNEKILNTCFSFKILFGEQMANTLKEKLFEIMFTSKLPSILSNKLIMDNLILTNNFSILNLIYKLMNRRNESLVLFQEKFFVIYVDRFYSDMKVPTNIREGLTYIEFLLERIRILNEIFTNSFGKDRRIQLRYKETVSLIINNKNIKNMYMLCGVYINEVMSRNVSNYEVLKGLLNNFACVLGSLEDAENFFLTVQKLLVKRVSNFKFAYENEFLLVKILREVFGVRHCFGVYRLLDDIKNSSEFFNQIKIENGANWEKGELNLFSFNALNKNDLSVVINPSKFSYPINDIVNTIVSRYNSKFPHRIITLSQNLSIVSLIPCHSNVELLVNFIQFTILSLLNCKNKSIRLEDLISTLEVKNIPYFRTNVLSLLSSNILTCKENSNEMLNTDELRINFDYFSTLKTKNYTLINLTNVTELSSLHLKKTSPNKPQPQERDELALSRDHTSQSDIHSLENSMESQLAIYNANKVYITDAKLMKIIKQFAKEGVEHNSLLKMFLQETKRFFSENNNPDIGFIKKRIDVLIERSLIGRKIEENKIIYEFL